MNITEEKILKAGVDLSVKHGAVNVTRKMVAEKAKVSPALVSHYMGGTKDAQAKYAKVLRKQGGVQPDRDRIAAIGVKLRAVGTKPHMVKKRVRKPAEIKAIKRNVASKMLANAKRAIRPRKKATVPSLSPVNDALVRALVDGGNEIALAGIKASKPPVARVKPAPKNKALPGAPENKGKYQPVAPPPGAEQ